MVTNNKPTNYLNAKGRRIFKGAQGGFFARAADGSKVYKPKAAFRKTGGEGAQVKIAKTRNNTNMIPSPLRPKVAKAALVKVKGGPRKKRVNAGVARGPRSGTLQRRMNAEAARRRARALVARKKRSNVGVKRGMRSGTLARRQAVVSARRRARLAAGPVVRKKRVNAGVARGPRSGTLQRRMNATSKRATARRAAGPVARKPRVNAGVKRGMRTPTEAALYKMIFGPEKKAVKAVKAMIISPGGTTYKSKAAATRRKKTSAKSSTRKKSGNRPNSFKKSPLGMMMRSGRTKK